METIVTEFIKVIPSVLWFLLFIIILIINRQSIRELLMKLGSIEAVGVKLTMVGDWIDAAIQLAEKSPQWKVEISAEEKERALNRTKKHLGLFKGVQILWVDDDPENNLNERRMFRQLNVDIDTAKSTEEALDMLKNGKYDLIISDMVRDNKPDAGIEFLQRFHRENKTIPVIFYMGIFDPEKGIPPLAFGATNRPDELLHLTLDILERKKD